MLKTTMLLDLIRRPWLDLDRALFVVAAPRAGTSLLLELLREAEQVYTLDLSSRPRLEALVEAQRGLASDRLDASAATAEIGAEWRARLRAGLRDRRGRAPRFGAVRLVDPAGVNALRIPFLSALFPEAQFIYLYREPREQLAHIVEAWRSGRFVSYPNLPGWDGPPWSLPLVPGWQALHGKELNEIAAMQWAAITAQVLEDLAELPGDRWCAVGYSDLLADPLGQAHLIGRFAGLRWKGPPHAGSALARRLAAARTIPEPDAIDAVLPLVAALAHQASGLARSRHPSQLELQSGLRRVRLWTLPARLLPQQLSRTLVAGSLATMLLGRASTPATAQATPIEVTILDDAGEGSLRDAISDANAAPGPDVITFQDGLNGEITLTTGPLEVTDSVAIQGPGADVITISGDNSSRVFYLYSDSQLIDVTISDLTITEGNANQGAGIFNQNENLVLEDLVITGNTAGADGGGLWMNGPDASLTIRDSEISDNSAGYSGGGVYIDEIGGSLLVQNTEISGNDASYYGGGIYVGEADDTVTIAYSTISNNYAYDDGGGAFFYYGNSAITIRNTEIGENDAGSDGGGIAWQYLYDGLTIQDSTISNNYAYEDGGAIYGENTYGSLLIRNTTISDNEAGYDGGGIYLDDTDTVTIEDSTISGNTAGDSGGGIYLEDAYETVTIRNTEISGNDAGDDGGGIYIDYTYGPVTIEDSIISGNTAGEDGGGVYVHQDAYLYYDGDAPTLYGGTLTIRNTRITGNEALDAGGGLSVQHHTLYYYGGGPEIPGPTAERGRTLRGHEAGEQSAEDGGSEQEGSRRGEKREREEEPRRDRTRVRERRTAESTPRTRDTIVAGNRLGEDRRAFHDSLGASVVIEDSIISDNQANDGGGAYLGLYGSAAAIRNTTITRNQAGADGGGIHLYGVYGGSTEIEDSTISDNTSGSAGGGIAAVSVYYSDVVIRNTTITGNEAVGGGGGIMAISVYASDTEIEDSTISDNTSESYGGGIAGLDLYGSTLTVQGSTVTENDAINGGPGGGVFSYAFLASGTEIEDSTISDNTSESDGGGILALADSYSGVTISGTTISGNQAQTDGGGATLVRVSDRSSEGLASIEGSAPGGNLLDGKFLDAARQAIGEEAISGNLAGENRRGFHYYDYNDALVIENTTISGNQATRGGGLVMIDVSDAEPPPDPTAAGDQALAADGPDDNVIRHSTIAGNTATESGGGLVLETGSVAVDHTIIADNTAGDLDNGPDAGFDVRYSLIESPGTANLNDLGGNVLNQDPQLAPLADNGGPTETHLPAGTSPAVDSGDPAFAPPPSTDQRGRDRVVGDAIDMGAVELAPGALQFSLSGYTVDEAGVTATITVTRTGGNEGVVTVDYTTSDGTATAGEDYTATSGTLTFDPGETEKTFTVPIGSDSLDEPDETVTLTLSNPTGGAVLGNPITATLTIVDDDPEPTVRFQSASDSVGEADGSRTITVTLSGPSAKPVTVDYATGDGTATAGEDYTAASGTLTFDPGETEQSLSLTIVDDDTDEPDETVTLTLSNPSNSRLGTPATFTLTIVDDEYRVFLPVMVRSVTYPDLVVESVRLSSSDVEVVILNQGDKAVTDSFWVDLYIDPEQPPTGVNQTWPFLSEEGLVWGVTESALPLEPGERLTLRLGDGYYRPDKSEFGGTIPAGTPVYVQVDSANTETTYGGVLEDHEVDGEPYNNVEGPVIAADSLETGAPDTDADDVSQTGRNLPERE